MAVCDPNGADNPVKKKCEDETKICIHTVYRLWKENPSLAALDVECSAGILQAFDPWGHGVELTLQLQFCKAFY